ncbi:hypothetical protein Tco_1264292 [Tanacetum coccineum]
MGRDTIQLEDAVSTISEEYLLEFTSEYGIPESLHLELPGPEEPIVEFSEGKVGVYTKFFEFANYRIPISQFLFDILGYYQIHLSQLSLIGATKQATGEEHPTVLYKAPGLLEELEQSILLGRRENIPHRRGMAHKRHLRDRMPSSDSIQRGFVTILNTHRTPIQKQPELLLCLVGLSRSYFLGDDVYPTFLYDDDRDMDLFNLINAPNPAKVKTGTRPRVAHEVPLLTITASRVIEIGDTTVTSGSSGTPSALEKSPLNFANEDPPQLITEMGRMTYQVQDGLSHEIPPVETATTTEVVQKPGLEKEMAAMGPPVNKRRRKRGNDEAEANSPPKVLRKDHAAFRPAQSTLGGISLASMGLEAGSTFFTPATQETPADAKSVSDPKPLSYVKPQPHPEQDVDQSSRKTTPQIPIENVATARVQDLLSTKSSGSGKSTSVLSMNGSPGMPLGYLSELRNLPNTDFQYNINLARQVAIRSQLRLRFEQEVRLLKKATAKIARRDQRIQVREEEIKRLDQEIKSLRTVESEVHDFHNWTKNLETLLEDEVDMKKAAEAKNAGQAKELESLREKIKAAFEEFKKYEDDRVEQRCAKIDARLDKLSVDFDEELYPHMLTAIAGRHWVIRHGLRLAVMKCAESPELRHAFSNVVSAGLVKGISEGLEHSIEHGKADRVTPRQGGNIRRNIIDIITTQWCQQ